MEGRYGGGKEAAWRAVFQQKYFSRLGTVLRRRRIQNATSGSARIRAVKLAADLSMAMTSKGRTAWSRAILGKYVFRLRKSRCILRGAKSSRNFRGERRAVCARRRPCKMSALCKKFPGRLLRRGINCQEVTEDTEASRMQTLRLLVPGSRGLDTPVFLKEAADYIVALKMQVQAMQVLADCHSSWSAHAAWQV